MLEWELRVGDGKVQGEKSRLQRQSGGQRVPHLLETTPRGILKENSSWRSLIQQDLLWRLTKPDISYSLPTPRVQELLPLFFSRAFIRSDMKSPCLPPPAIRGGPVDCGSPSCPAFSSLFGGSGTGFFAGRAGGLLQIGGGGGGNGTSPLMLPETGGGGGTKSGGGS